MNMLKIEHEYRCFSTLMTYVRNILNWSDPGGQMIDMTENYSL